MSRLHPALIERDHNDDDHGSTCGRCEGRHGDEVVVIVPRPADAPLSFCSLDCAHDWLDEQRVVDEAEARADYEYDRRRERDQVAA